jgi:hypothetical protein
MVMGAKTLVFGPFPGKKGLLYTNDRPCPKAQTLSAFAFNLFKSYVGNLAPADTEEETVFPEREKSHFIFSLILEFYPVMALYKIFQTYFAFDLFAFDNFGKQFYGKQNCFRSFWNAPGRSKIAPISIEKKKSL